MGNAEYMGLTETTAAKSWGFTAICCYCPLYLTAVRRHATVSMETSAAFHSGTRVKVILPAPLSRVLMASLGATQNKGSVNTASILATLKPPVATVGNPINVTVATSTNAAKDRDPVTTTLNVRITIFVFLVIAASMSPVHLELPRVALDCIK